ncbi:YqzL family protein [Bacillaceae bacterium W0354]
MIELPWKVFEKTGNIETYLLMKQMEEAYRRSTNGNHEHHMKTSFSNSRT